MSSSEFDPEWAQTIEWLEEQGRRAAAEECENPGLIADRYNTERRRVSTAAVATMEKYCVPSRFITPLATGKLRETSAVAKVRAWLRLRSSWCLILSSTYSVGKSQAMASALWDGAVDRAERGLGSRPGRCWYSAAQIARMGNYKQGDFDAAADATTLCVDDLAGEFLDKAGAFLSLLGDLLNERYANERRTIITTNLNADEFKERVGPRIVERIREGGVFAGVAGPNLRKSGATDELPLALAGGVAAPHHSDHEPEERERVIVLPRAQYLGRTRSPRADARRRQLQLPLVSLDALLRARGLA